MSIQPAPIDPVPDETRRVARAAFPKGNPYLTLRDQLGTIFQDDHFADLYPNTGQPGLSPWRLAWVTILQFRESLSDRQAAEAVRARIDWKYLLGLDLTDCGFDFSVLSEFRGRLLAGSRTGATVGPATGVLPDSRTAEDPRPAACRLDPCPGGHPHAQSPGTHRRNHARRPQRVGPCRSRMASGRGPHDMVRTLRCRGDSIAGCQGFRDAS